MDLIAIAGRLLQVSDINTYLVLFGLMMTRLLTAILLAPFFGGQSVPPRLRVGLAAMLAALLMPGEQEKLVISPLLVLGLMAKEVMIGALLGMACQFVFYGIQAAGVLIDTQRGMNQMNFTAPQLPGPASILAQIQVQAAIALFVAANGHHLYIQALGRSFTAVPVLTFPRMDDGVVDTAIRLSGNTLGIALQLAGPVLIVLLLVDVSFGVLNRIANQINVHSESQPVKAMVGLGVFLLMIGFLMSRVEGYLGGMMTGVAGLVQALKP